MLSPAFYVHDLHVHDITTIPPKSSGRPSIPIQMTRRFPGRNHIPATTLLSFYRRKLFNVIYANPALVLDLKGDPKVVEVKMRLKMHAADIRMRIPRLVLCLPYSKMTEAQPLTQDHKNALEEYVYDTRGQLDDCDASYLQPADKGRSLSALAQAHPSPSATAKSKTGADPLRPCARCSTSTNDLHGRRQVRTQPTNNLWLRK